MMKFLTGVNDGVNEINRVEKEIDELKQVIKHLFEIEIDNLIFDFNVTKQCKESDGGTPEAIKLMGIIREKMIEKNLAYDWTNGEQISKKEEIKKKRQKYFSDHSKNHYQHSFPETYELEKNKLLSYYDDGWNYGDSKKHYYYNELDHYLTHLVGNIAQNKKIGNCEEGLKTIREEVLMTLSKRKD